jgi:hypothetical protein
MQRTPATSNSYVAVSVTIKSQDPYFAGIKVFLWTRAIFVRSHGVVHFDEPLASGNVRGDKGVEKFLDFISAENHVAKD